MIFTVEIEVLKRRFVIRNIRAFNEVEAQNTINTKINTAAYKNGKFTIFGVELTGTAKELKDSYKIISVEKNTEKPDYDLPPGFEDIFNKF